MSNQRNVRKNDRNTSLMNVPVENVDSGRLSAKMEREREREM